MKPNEVVKSVLNLSDKFLNNIQKERCGIVKYPGYEFPSANKTPQNVCYFKNFNYEIKNSHCNATNEH